jgi:signal transduction histidine kinase
VTSYHVFIEVADTGVGIAPEDLPKVTEPFFTTKPEGKGTGLGLPICRRVVQEHGGSLAIASAGPGQGAMVRVTLPIQNKTNGNALTTA